MHSQESDRVATFFAQRMKAGATAAHIADTIGATCQGIDLALTPIIGQRGVAALYLRSLHLAGRTHAWLTGAQPKPPTAIDVAALTSLLAQRSSADAAAGAGLFLQTFYELLDSLIGPSLTERLLRSVWATFLSGPPAQDISP